MKFEGGETRLVVGEKDVAELGFALLERASGSAYLHGLTDRRFPRDLGPAKDYIEKLYSKNPAFKFRLIADIQKDNVEYYKMLIAAGVEVRHIGGNMVSFITTAEEYMAASIGALEQQLETGASVPKEVIWSNREDVVSQAEQIFHLMWQGAVHSDSRIRELEEGVEPELTLVLEDMKEVIEIGKGMTDECKEEALMILATTKTILRNEGLFSRLAEKMKNAGLKVRVLAPDLDPQAMGVIPGAVWKKIQPQIDVTILIYDRKRMFITQYSNMEANTPELAVANNIYSTSIPTISSIVSVFGALWNEAELREEEEKSRKQAELLQDVLSHDIRNYNQILKFNVELLLTETDSERRARLLAMMARAVDDSGQLIERTKKLGKIIAQEHVHLTPMDIMQSVERARSIVAMTYPEKHIDYVYEGEPGARVLADELLDEVFVNIISNSVRYTKGNDVSVKVQVSSALPGGAKEYKSASDASTAMRRIVLTDKGPGIPDLLKEKVFRRYLDGASGSGLGLSIVRALVVDRYSGRVKTKDAVEGDHTKGMSMEIWLQDSDSSL
jgi:signal transduction histidine kinase